MHSSLVEKRGTELGKADVASSQFWESPEEPKRPRISAGWLMVCGLTEARILP